MKCFWNRHCSSRTVPTVPFPRLRFSLLCLISLPHSFFLFLSHAILPSAILFLLPLPLTPSPFLSPSLPQFLGWLLCLVRIEAFCSPSFAPLSLCTAVAGPWMQNNVFCCIRLLIFLIILSCSIVGCDTFFALKCTVYECVCVCVHSPCPLSYNVLSLCLSNETCLHLTVFCPPFNGDRCFSA